ncbi:MAG: hypothetical protein JNM56_05205, partial [Planctomycetia bacterium]|nr:hypothetical protein [Planctomycetia bacterium]
DHITEHGFLNIGHVRDALARNQLKLPDLNGVGEFFAGDPLLRANRQLAQQAAGVYQRGEIYLRWLQRGTALAFGTRPGRWLTRFVALPFGGAYATIIFAEEMLHLADKFLYPGQPPFHLHSPALETTIAGLGLFYLLLLHLPAFRNLFVQGCRLAWSGVRTVCMDLPLGLWRLPAFRRFVSSAAFVAVVRYVVKPLPVAVLVGLSLWLSGRSVEVSLRVGGAALLLASVALNVRWTRLLEDALIDWAARRWDYFRELLPGLFRLVMDTFKTVLEAIDRLLYSVDEWLRFRGGESPLTRGLKAILGLAWSLVSYVVRVVVIVFVEPTVNPVKHFPAVTVAAKLLVPFWVPLTEFFGAPLLFLGEPVAYAIGFFILHLLPGAAGFLVWELQENWRLYRANRSESLRPAGIGHHGETLVQLLKPGFHSGTLPKLFARLRRAERRALRTRNWQASRRLRTALHHVEHGIQRFAERELLAYLNGHPRWTAGRLHVVRVEAGSNRVRLELTCPSLAAEPLELHFEEQSGWLVAHVARPGWVTALAPDQTALWTLALTGFYHRGGVDLVREQLEAHLPQPCPPYDITDAGLLVWPGLGYEVEVLYDLRAGPRLFPRILAGKADIMPVLDARQLRFSAQSMPWVEWVKAWENGAASGASFT